MSIWEVWRPVKIGAYQETLGATMTAAQWDRLDSLQGAFLDAYLAAFSEPEEPR